MSVYTHLTDEQFGQFCRRFGLDFKRATPITQGIKNSNWFIETTDDADGEPSYVFTLFEERKPYEIHKMAMILDKLQDKLPVACPLKADNGEFLLYFDNKAILLLPKLSGSHPSHISLQMCYQMGEALAILHKTLQTLTPAQHYAVELYPWHLVKDREIQFMPSDEARLLDDIWIAYERLTDKNLPKGLCHLDMFADNTLWQFDKAQILTGLLDFTEVSVDYFVMDLAITINDFCTTWGEATSDTPVFFDRTKMNKLIDGYDSIRPLTADEKSVLPIMLAKAAVTFWLLRLNVIYYNRQQGRAGETIMIKNPDLMKRLASYHWGFVQSA